MPLPCCKTPEVRALVDQNSAPEGLRALHTLVQALQLGRRGRLPEPTMQVLVAIAKEDPGPLRKGIRCVGSVGFQELEQLTAKSERSETSQAGQAKGATPCMSGKALFEWCTIYSVVLRVQGPSSD